VAALDAVMSPEGAYRCHSSTSTGPRGVDGLDAERIGRRVLDRLFHMAVDRSPEAFQRWAEDGHEVPVDLEAVRHVFCSRPLTEEVVPALNSEIVLADLSSSAEEAGPGHWSPNTHTDLTVGDVVHRVAPRPRL
jgi:hypothetical protein